MPRKARIDAARAIHHIIGRGINRCAIFRENHDREDFLLRLAAILQEAHTPCYAWALMSNHFHLILKTGQIPISQVMLRLLTGYAISYNHRHHRSGHLFQNRYKSILCDEEAYLLELVRYIHLNPIRAGAVSSIEALEKYPYTGHSALVGKQKRVWQDTDTILRLFSRNRSTAQEQYRRFVAKTLDQGKRDDLIGGGLLRSAGGWAAVNAARRQQVNFKSDERILGDSNFVDRMLQEAKEGMEQRTRLQDLGVTLETVIRRVAHILGCSPEEVQQSGKERLRVVARSLLCYWSVRELGVTQAELGRRLSLSSAGVTFSVRRGEKLAHERGYTLLVATRKVRN